MYCSEMLESWEEQSASCDESAQGDRPQKTETTKRHSEHGITHEP